MTAGWRSIETAPQPGPKDKPIDLWVTYGDADSKRFTDCRWDPHFGGYWITDSGVVIRGRPTHWMYSPCPPETDQ